MTTEGRTRERLLLTSNPDRAEEWATILDAAGIDVLVEITDAQTADPGSSPLVGVLGVRPLEFVHLVMVPPEQREAALRALVDAGWDGREGLRLSRAPNLRGLVTATLFTAAGIAAFILIRMATG